MNILANLSAYVLALKNGLFQKMEEIEQKIIRIYNN